jgi:hypothetical protein
MKNGCWLGNPRWRQSLSRVAAGSSNHPSPEWTAVGTRTLRVRDLKDPTDAMVEMDFAEEMQPLCCRADRPRLVGKESVVSPWFGTCRKFHEWEGFNIASCVEAGWQLRDGPFVYFKSEITSFTVQD